MSTLKVTNLANPTSASTNIALDTNGNATVAGTVAMGTSFLRNRIINGAMDIAQRGTTFSNQSAYSLDRWFTNRNGGATGVTFGQTYGAFGSNKNWMSVQRTAGNTNTASAVMYQAIEGVNSRDLAGQTVTASFTLCSGSTLSVTTNNVTAVIYYQTTTTDIGPNGSWTALSGVNFSVANNTGPTRYSAQFSIPSNATQLEMVIGFQFAGTAGADDRYYITEVQLEAGSVATPFERRQYGQELALCQRYYEVSGTYNVFSGNTTSGVGYYHSVRYAVTKRANPSVTATDVNNNGFAAGAPSIFAGSTDILQASKTSNATVNGGYFSYSWVASVEL